MKTTRRTFLKSIGLGVAALAAPGCAGALSSGQTAATAKPNIIVIMADDMGFSDSAATAARSPRRTSTRLAAGGLRFTQFYNAARCCPTRALAPDRPVSPPGRHRPHGRRTRACPSYQGYLNDRCVTIAEALGPAGYTTADAASGTSAPLPSHWPLQRGFDRFFGPPSGGGVYFKPDDLAVPHGNVILRPGTRTRPPDDGT